MNGGVFILKKTFQTAGCFILSGILALSIGCSAQKKPLNTAPNTAPKNTSFKKVYNPPRIISPIPAIQPPARNGVTAMADAISKKAMTVKGVKSAYVMVAGVGGKTAFVGIQLDTAMAGSKAANIKKAVAEKLKNYPGVTKVLVTANPGIVQNIRKTMTGTPPDATIMDLTKRIKAER